MASAPNIFPTSSLHLRLLVTRSKILWNSLRFVEKSLSTFLFFSRYNKAVSMKRREERRLMILACWQCAWNQKVKNTHATHLARMTASTQNRTCLLWNCKLFSFVRKKIHCSSHLSNSGLINSTIKKIVVKNFSNT